MTPDSNQRGATRAARRADDSKQLAGNTTCHVDTPDDTPDEKEKKNNVQYYPYGITDKPAMKEEHSPHPPYCQLDN